MSNHELKEIALRFAIQADRGVMPFTPAEIVRRANAYFEFMRGTEKTAKKRR